MDINERVERMRRMRTSVKEHNIYWWASSLIGALCELRLDQPPDPKESVVTPIPDKLTVEI